MMRKSKAIGIFVAALLAVSAGACGGPSSGGSSETGDGRVNLLMDPSYSTGLEVSAPGEPVYTDLEDDGYFSWVSGGEIDYGGTATGTGPLWSLAQHASSYSLVDPAYRTPEVKEDGTYVYSDPAKTVAVNRGKNSITLGIKGSVEYSSDDDGDGIRDGENLLPRSGSEPWVHLLLTSTLYPKMTVRELEKLEFEIDMTLEQCDDVLADRGMEELFNPNAHAAQVTMFFMVYSNAAADQGKYFWFGIPLFDARYDRLDPSIMFDRGTSSWMVGTGTDVVLSEKPQVGKTYQIRYDMIADLKTGLEKCREQGALLNTTVDDLYIQDFNIGWELPGIYDVGITFENFGVYATRKG